MTEPKESQIAEEHRRILVNEYCRNVAQGNPMIKCDECIHHSECVEYGWKPNECKMFEPITITNDDWRRNATTEEFAEWVVEVVFGDEFKKHIKQIGFAHMHSYKTEVVEWLKQLHKE